MQRRKTSVWTPDNDPRSRRQKQESQQPEKESQPQQKAQAAQEPKPHMAGRLATDKPKPKPKVQPQVKPETQPKPQPSKPKEATETQAKVKEDKPKASKGKPQSKAKRKRKREPRDQRAIDYFQKQIREKKPMVFIGYGETVDCTIINGWLYEWVLVVDEERNKRKKTDFSCCYKQSDAEKVLAVMITDLAVANQKLNNSNNVLCTLMC